jgi:hypothetical protein
VLRKSRPVAFSFCFCVCSARGEDRTEPSSPARNAFVHATFMTLAEGGFTVCFTLLQASPCRQRHERGHGLLLYASPCCALRGAAAASASTSCATIFSIFMVCDLQGREACSLFTSCVEGYLRRYSRAGAACTAAASGPSALHWAPRQHCIGRARVVTAVASGRAFPARHSRRGFRFEASRRLASHSALHSSGRSRRTMQHGLCPSQSGKLLTFVMAGRSTCGTDKKRMCTRSFVNDDYHTLL